jgi:DNA helicase-2/ATP-dependent DNA helicase PcrA
MMVGDPNQSIFHFTGSSPNYMDKHFVDDFGPDIVKLNENYRSSKAVLSAARKIIPDAEDIVGTVKEGIFEMNCLEDEETEAKWITAKIKELINLREHEDIEGNINFEKIAVLARNKYVFNKLEPLLDEKGMDYYYKMTPGPIQFESNLMKAFDLSLRIKLNPQDTLHKNRLLKLLNLNPVDDAELEVIASKLNDELYNQLIKTVLKLNEDGSNFKRELKNFQDKILIQDDNERKMILNDIEELLKHWFNYSKKTDDISLSKFRNAIALGQTHPLVLHNGITLSTVHTMKGQEFDIVFLMGMDDETFPDYRAIRNNGIELIQEKNNLYVAFTRAKRFLYVTWPQKRLMPWGEYKNRKISRFIKDL